MVLSLSRMALVVLWAKALAAAACLALLERQDLLRRLQRLALHPARRTLRPLQPLLRLALLAFRRYM